MKRSELGFPTGVRCRAVTHGEDRDVRCEKYAGHDKSVDRQVARHGGYEPTEGMTSRYWEWAAAPSNGRPA